MIGAVVVGAMAMTGAGIWWATTATTAAPIAAPGVSFLVPADSRAAQAAEDASPGPAAESAAYLAAQPTAVWLTPEADPIDAVGDRVGRILDEARAQDATAVIVVYGVPDRDCGSLSRGGLSSAEYRTWIEEIGAALERSAARAVVVLEPDSLAQLCGDAAARTRLLAAAAERLAGERTWVYVDGGHSDWIPVDEMAARIAEVVSAAPGAVRGFATNVSNARSDRDERAYAARLADRIADLADADLRAVIDTSRNGAGAPSDGEWCNAPGLRVGAPAGSYGDAVVDVNLWVKPPGESDGPCNGGPGPGLWWSEAAISLTRDTG